MPGDNLNSATHYKTVVQEKIKGLLREYSTGDISREQFQVIYERYNRQLLIANQALLLNNSDSLKNAEVGSSTHTIRLATMGKPIGIAIYHRRSGTIVQTLGHFDVEPMFTIATLNELASKLSPEEAKEAHIQQMAGGNWLLYAYRDYTAVITIFDHEPSRTQAREIERLHDDFEEANAKLLNSDSVNANELVNPFTIFVKTKRNP